MPRIPTTAFDAAFRSRLDPGANLSEWPDDLKNELRKAAHRVRTGNPELGRLVGCEAWVENKPSTIFLAYPYIIHFTLHFERPNLH